MTAVELIADLRRRGLTIATAESLTGGLLCGALTDVPGASVVVRGAVVAYGTDVKASMLGVRADLLAREGAVHPEVARQMAMGVCCVLDADVGVATTGVAGPDPQDGQPVGTVFVGVCVRDRLTVRRLAFSGSRAAIRTATVGAALELVEHEVGTAEDPQPLDG